MRVLNISSNDYSNVSHENANALRSIGVDCRDAKIYKHNFKYTTESQIVTYKQILDVCRYYDIIQIFHSDKELYRLVKNQNKKIIIYHTGTAYRQNSNMYDRLFNGCTILTDQCEFIVGDNMKYIAPHVNLKKVLHKNKKPVVGHFPSNKENKGTQTITRLLSNYKGLFDIRINSTIVSHPKNMERISKCDYYVEMLNSKQNGKLYGCHGVTAFEAAALGCKVITNNIKRNVYEEVYGDYPFLIANTESEFIDIFEHIKDGGEFELPSVFKNHNIKSTGKRILELIS